MESASDEGTAAETGAELPVALAAVTVAGQCRERSPIDLALFGEEAERFVDRFADPGAGESLLLRAVAEGAAEGRATLVTPAGARDFRVSLWRQRGGEKVRLIAAFAAAATGTRAASVGLPPQVARIAHDLLAPLGALMAGSDALRGAAAEDQAAVGRHAADIAAAAWRVLRLADELRSLDAAGSTARGGTIGEVDLGRLAGRVRRMALAEATAAGVTLAPLPPAAKGAGLPGVMSDESLLWGLIDDLLRHAIRGAGAGGAVSLALEETPGQGLALTVAARPAGDGGPPATAERAAPRPAATAPRAQGALRELAAAAGGTLDLRGGGAEGLLARLGFLPARCLPPVADT